MNEDSIHLKLSDDEFNQVYQLSDLKNLFKDENLDKITFFYKKIILAGSKGITYKRLQQMYKNVMFCEI